MSDKLAKIKESLNNLNAQLDHIQNDNQKRFGDQGPENSSRVIHLVNNPFLREIETEDAEYEQLKKENERLCARLRLIETGVDANVTMRIDEAINDSQKIKILEQKIDEFKLREDKILTSLKKTASEFRQACLSLIGYRVDALKGNIYRLTHRYAEREEDRLYFEVKRDGTILLQKNDYARQYDNLLETYLERGDSFPAFLAAITLDLFKRTQSQTQASDIDMSVTMSTTVVPANTTRRSLVVDRRGHCLG